MILIFSNRNVNLQQQGVKIFQPCLNTVGAEDVLLATAKVDPAGDWLVNLVPSPPQGNWMACGPSCALLADVVKRMKAGEHDDHPGGLRYDEANKTYNWIFFIPGYSSTPSTGLEHAKQLEKEYQANVMLFSWPADPQAITSDPIRAYRQAQASARVSAIHLDHTLEAIAQLFADPLRNASARVGFRFCLLMHSLGNYLFESFVRAPIYSDETKIFDTIVLHQPDISENREQDWIGRVRFRDSLYLTYNKYDSVLRFSMLINDVRAGIAGGADPDGLVKFIDFTHGRMIAASHFMFSGLDNKIVHEACRRMIRGVPGGEAFNLSLDGANGFTLHHDTNTYVLSDPDWQTINNQPLPTRGPGR
jgi:hypothetical protein